MIYNIDAWSPLLLDPLRFGGKAYGLGLLAEHVQNHTPPGVYTPGACAIPWHDLANLDKANQLHKLALAVVAFFPNVGRLAVRSSAVGEDGVASFAGQFRTVLGCRDSVDVEKGLRAVLASANNESVTLYRERLGLKGPLHMAVVVQEMVEAEFSGVVYTRNPVTDVDQIIIEMAHGTGGVVDGAPPLAHYRFAPGESADRLIPAYRAMISLVLTAARSFAAPVDVEWAYAAGRLALLQARPITGRGVR